MSNEADMAVLIKTVKEHDVMLRGNGDPGLYKAVIKTGERMETVLRKMNRIESVFWSVFIIVLASFIIGGFLFYARHIPPVG